MDIKGLVYSILEYKKHKDASQLQLIEIYKKQIKHDLIAAFEMSHDIVRENRTLFLNSPSFLTFLLRLIDNDNSLSFVMTRGSFRNHSEPVGQQKLETECEELRTNNEKLKKEIKSLQTPDAVKKENERLKSKLTTVEKEKAELEEKLRSESEKNLTLKKQIQETSSVTEDRLKQTQDEKVKIEQQLRESLSQIDTGKAENRDLQKRFDQCVKQTQDRDAKISELEQQLAECLKQNEKPPPEFQKELFTMLYNFLLKFNGDNPITIQNMFQYFEAKLANTLARLENDYRLLQEWALTNFNIQKKDFSVSYLVSNADSSGCRVSSIENVCLNNAPSLTEQQALGLSQNLQEAMFIADVLKKQFGEELLLSPKTYPEKLRRIALHSDMFKTIQHNLTPIFGQPVDEQNFLEKIQKVIQFVLNVLSSMKSGALPESFPSLTDDILLAPSPVIALPGSEPMSAEQTSESRLNTQSQSQLDNCMRKLELCENDLNLFKGKLATCEENVSTWEKNCEIESQKFQNVIENLKRELAAEINASQRKSQEIIQLHEENSVLKLQLDQCLMEKKQLKSITENEDFKVALQAKNTTIEELANKTQALETENETLKTQLQEQRKKHTRCETDLEKCLDKKTNCLNENEKLVMQLTNLTANIDALSGENEKLKSSLQKKAENEELPTDQFKNDEPRSRKRKLKSQDADISEPDFEMPDEALARCIEEKEDITRELKTCQEKLQYYENTFKDANYISTHNQTETALNISNLKSLFVAFFVHYFRRRVEISKVEESTQLLNQLKELLDNLQQTDKNEYNSIFYFYVRKQISSFTTDEPAHLQHVTDIETLLQTSLTETKRQLRDQSIKTGLKSFFKQTFRTYVFPNESNMDSIKHILQYLHNICNTNVVIDMEHFLLQLDTISSSKYAEQPEKSQQSKVEFILHAISIFS